MVIKRKRFNNKKGKNGADGDDSASQNRPRIPYTSFASTDELQNERFEQYYRGAIVPENEWDTMINSMREPLPVSFRLSNIGGTSKKLQTLLNGTCFGLPEEPVTVTSEDTAPQDNLPSDPSQSALSTSTTVTIQRPHILPWYRPKGNAYQIAIPKRALKRFPQLSDFRQFLMKQDRVGSITRQESVSMIPPLLLDVKSHHVVLDMCAAPGSKTSQLLEALHSDLKLGEIPTGIVIANDSSPDRAYMLVHQLKRLGSPSFLVTTHLGQLFPGLFVPQTSSLASKQPGYETITSNTTDSSSTTTTPFTRHTDADLTAAGYIHHTDYFTSVDAPIVRDTSTGDIIQPKVPLSPLLFDRILCDVPCSGDGTMRKTPTVWAKWTCNDGLALHPLQSQIAWRGAQMLKQGGLMVYSTCSLNPMEDESVITDLINRSNGALELVDIKTILPELKCLPGNSQWNTYAELPKNKDLPQRLCQIKNLKDVLALPVNVRKLFRPSMFSPDVLAVLIEEVKVYAEEQKQKWLNYVKEHENDPLPVDDNDNNTSKSTTTPAATDNTTTTDDVSQQQPTSTAKNTKNNNKPNWKQRKRLEQPVLEPFFRLLLRTKVTKPIDDIDKTVRVLPHQQDTGGFYIALIRKVGMLPSYESTLDNNIDDVYYKRYDHAPDWNIAAKEKYIKEQQDKLNKMNDKKARKDIYDKEQEECNDTAIVGVAGDDDDNNAQEQEEQSTTTTKPSTQNNNKRGTQQHQQATWTEKPFTPIQSSFYTNLKHVWDGNIHGGAIMTRSDKKVYLMSDAVSQIIQTPENYKLKIVHGGLKAFENDPFFGTLYSTDLTTTNVTDTSINTNDYYRVCQEGVRYIYPIVKNQILHVTKDDMLTLLNAKGTTTTHFRELTPAVQDLLYNNKHKDSTDKQHVSRSGSIIVCYHDIEDDQYIICSAMKRGHSISLLVDQNDRESYSYLLGYDDSNTTTTTSITPDDEIQPDQEVTLTNE